MTQRIFIGPKFLLLAGALLTCAALTGCPAPHPALSVSPVALNFGDGAVTESFTIFNSGGGTLNWSIAIATSSGGDWLVADVMSGAATTETDRVRLTALRAGLAPGTYTATVTVTSNAGSQVVRVALTEPGAPALQITPTLVDFGASGVSGSFTLQNVGAEAVSWALASQAVNPALPAWLQANPSSGTTPASESVVVALSVDRSLLPVSMRSFTLLVVSSSGSQPVTLSFAGSAASEAKIAVEPALLDFGTEAASLTFDVYNSGEPGSTLTFTATSGDSSLFSVQPGGGTSVAVAGQQGQDRVKLTVTLHREAIDEDAESGVITLSAPGTQAVEVALKATRAPLIFEGAQNRSRPPFLKRFVFLLRDSVGRALDTLDPDVMANLQTAFSIYEDERPLDLDESNFFVTNAKHLRYNVVLLLDYTGSMYGAEPGNGAAIQQMKAGAAGFIADLPDTYRVAVMEYHERQQRDRLIHGFSTAKQPILDALAAFDIPPADHGASEIFDAVSDGITRLANEDVTALPFDDADVRALVFVTDGRDTSSVATKEQMLTLAKDNRVRLYPIGFGNRVDSDMLRDIAKETGGHYYAAPSVTELTHLLDRQIGAPPDAPGLIAAELARQVVLSYVALFQAGTHTYLVSAVYKGERGSFQREGVFTDGDVRAGQLELRTAGIQEDGTAEVILRSEYIPRNISQLRVRLFTGPLGIPYTMEIVPDGLLSGWTLVPETESAPPIPTSQVFTVLTTENAPLRYGAFGNLLRIKFSGLQPTDAFALGLRVDNRVYVNPPVTKFFQYPEFLAIGPGSNQATVMPLPADNTFNPNTAGAWDADGDTFDDFNDLFQTDPLKH